MINQQLQQLFSPQAPIAASTLPSALQPQAPVLLQQQQAQGGGGSGDGKDAGSQIMKMIMQMFGGG